VALRVAMNRGLEFGQWTRLQDLCSSLFSENPLLVASNRGPLEHYISSSGRIETRRGSGAIVTALQALTQMAELTWISAALGEGDRKIIEQLDKTKIKSNLPGQQVHARYVNIPRRTYHKYYNVFCNPLLWYLQNYMWNFPYNPNLETDVHQAWETGYVTVNKLFSEAVKDESLETGRDQIILIHDYHLYLLAGYIRKEFPNAIIQHFSHIPWPSSHHWLMLPKYIREAICGNMIAANILGFQSKRDVRNFLNCCEEFLPDCQIDYAKSLIVSDLGTCQVKAYPISMNIDDMERIAGSSRVAEYECQLREQISNKVIVRVDRGEPTKNIVRGFKAFELLLNRHPQLRGTISFLAFVVPSRPHIRQYQRYMEEINRTVDDINAKFGTESWQPIVIYSENNYTQAVAGLKLYDVLLVNPVIDGMNLIAKEGPIVNGKNGTVILSETTGAFQELQDWVLGVSPTDIEGTMEAMYHALTLSDEERKLRCEGLTQHIKNRDISNWLYDQISDISALITKS
jgi:trehalose 6-phosphate synthase